MTLRRRIERLAGAADEMRTYRREYERLSDAELLAEIQSLLDGAGTRGGLPVPQIAAADLPALRAAVSAPQAENGGGER